MPSLAQILTDHGSALVLDAASTRIQVGLLQADAPALWRESGESEAGTAVFTLTSEVLHAADRSIDEVGAFIFCEGPGSMLGVRTVAMALRTWQALIPRACYSYQSLAVAGRAAWRTGARRAFAVIADARRETWHQQLIAADGQLDGPLARLPVAALAAHERVTPENFRTWSTLPPDVLTVSYRLAELFPIVVGDHDFAVATLPDAFQHEAPEYKKWSAQIHQAAPTSPK